MKSVNFNIKAVEVSKKAAKAVKNLQVVTFTGVYRLIVTLAALSTQLLWFFYQLYLLLSL